MPKVIQTTIQCAQCRQPVRATVHSLVDAAQEPQAKVAFLSGRLNVAICQNCGAPNTVLTPLVYHDPAKELLITYVPMELGLSKDAQEKAVGELMREVTSSLPQGGFKAYLLQPRSALTMQGFIDQVLTADGVTPEMMEAQRARVSLIEQFLSADPDELPELVKQHDTQIDAQFFQTMTLAAQQLLAQGRQGAAQQVVGIQSVIAQLSSFGQQLLEQSRIQEETIQQVEADVNGLGEEADRSDFLKLAIRYAADPERLQALVGLVRPVFDYNFFQEMTAHISAAPAAERSSLETLRDHLLELTSLIDQQAQAALQEAAGLLQEILNNPNPDEVIQANLGMLDYTFMQVLSANIQEATRRNDLNATARLKEIYNRIVAALQANMPPEIQFINDLLSAPTDDDARQLMAQHIGDFDAELLDVMDAVQQQLAAQGDPALLQRLALLRSEAAQSFA